MSEKQTKKQLFGEMFRFVLVGGISTIVDYLTLLLFDGVLLPLCIPGANEAQETLLLGIATALGYCLGTIVNWILSVRFVFQHVQDKKKSSSTKSFLIFVVLSVFGLILTELGVLLLVTIIPEFVLFGSATLMGTHTTWAELLAKAIMTVVVMVCNYILRKLLIFK